MNNDNLTELTRQNIFFPALMKIISFSSSAVVMWLFGKKLAVDEYGIYNIFQAFSVYMSIFSSLGLPLMQYRFFPELQEKKAFDLMRKILVIVIFLRGIFAFALIQLVIGFYDKIAVLFHITGFKNLFALWGIGIILSIEMESYLLTFSSLFFHRYYTGIFALYSILRLIFVSYALLAGYHLKGVIIAEILALCLQFFFLSLTLLKKFPKETNPLAKEEFSKKRLIKYAIYSYFQDIADVFFYINTDFFVISYFLGNIKTGLYAMGANLAFMISRWYPVELFIDIIRPIFFKRYAREKTDQSLSEMFSFLFKVNLFFSLPIFVFLLVVGKEFLSIFFPKYKDSYYVLFTVGFFIVIRGPRTALEMCVYAKEKLKITLRSKIFSLYNLFADIVFVTSFGILGAAFASGSSELFRFIYIYRALSRETKIRLLPQKCERIILNSLFLGLFLIPLKYFLTSATSFFLVCIFSIFVYLFVSYRNNPFLYAEIEIIKKVFNLKSVDHKK